MIERLTVSLDSLSRLWDGVKCAGFRFNHEFNTPRPSLPFLVQYGQRDVVEPRQETKVDDIGDLRIDFLGKVQDEAGGVGYISDGVVSLARGI